MNGTGSPTRLWGPCSGRWGVAHGVPSNGQCMTCERPACGPRLSMNDLVSTPGTSTVNFLYNVPARQVHARVRRTLAKER
jgi:hypothetical protein